MSTLHGGMALPFINILKVLKRSHKNGTHGVMLVHNLRFNE